MEGPIELIRSPSFLLQVEEGRLIARSSIRLVEHLPEKNTVYLKTETDEFFVFDPYGVLWGELSGEAAELWARMSTQPVPASVKPGAKLVQRGGR